MMERIVEKGLMKKILLISFLMVFCAAIASSVLWLREISKLVGRMVRTA